MMESNPLVTIIIATYNSENYIRQALASVANQSFGDWECLVVDGKSSDKTIEIVKEYQVKDKRFRWISEPDKGIYDAFNKGYRNARGFWIYYLGSDDELYQNGLKDLLDIPNAASFDVIYGGVMMKLADGTEMVGKITGHHNLPYRMFTCHQGAITKRQAIEELNGFDINLKIIADFELYIRLFLARKYHFKCQPNVLVAKFMLGGASSNLFKMLKENKYVCRKNHLGYKYMLFQYARTTWLFIKRFLGIYKSL